MGTFADITGKVAVPKDKLPELTERMLKVMNLSGMMDAVQVEHFGKTITLLKPVAVEHGKYIDCIFNYFEHEFWENAGFNIEKGYVYSSKIGRCDFHAAVLAMYVLQEFYSTTPCVTNVDGRPIDAHEYIGWLNYVLGEHYDNSIRFPGNFTPIPSVCSELFFVPRRTSELIGGTRAGMWNSPPRCAGGWGSCGKNTTASSPTPGPPPPTTPRVW